MSLIKSKNLFCFLALVALAACSGSSTSSSNNNNNNDDDGDEVPVTSSVSFPASLAITSPTAVEEDDAQPNISALRKIQAATAFETETAEIEAILTATDLADCAAPLEDLFTSSVNAECYGPQVAYSNHPDGGDGISPLPTGDLGLWLETNEEGPEACAAAQLNARMEGVTDKTSAAMMALASMICTINNTEGLALPEDGSTLSMPNEMQAMLTAASMSGVTVNTADIGAQANDAGTTDYTYSLNITADIEAPGEESPTETTTVQINMTHRPLDAENSTYRGQFSYYFIGRDDEVGNCNRDFEELNTADVTELGSVVYDHASATSVIVDARYAQACGENNTAPLVDGQLDPSIKAVSGMDPEGPSLEGWAANFTLLKAAFDPTTGYGDYVFAWQAGVGDGTARTFNLHSEDSDEDDLTDAIAFFGYGDDIEESDGSILGMYCNWAGPNGGVGNQVDKRQDLVQRQAMEQNETDGTFEPTTSNILYAPTTDCNVDSSDVTGGFAYDTDLDGNADVASELTNELVAPDDESNGISASGFALPSSPESL